MPSEHVLSIIIVAYKSRDEISACLGSLPRELRLEDCGSVEVEAIVVDNSPGDGVDEIVPREFPWVRYLPATQNLGFGSANNLGYAQTSGEFVLFLNPDTVCNEEALTHCVSRLRNDPTIGMISPKLVLRDGSMDLACRRSIPTLWDGFCRASGLAAAFPRTKCFSGYNLTHLPENGTYDVGAINGAFMMGRRSVFDAVAGSGKFDAISIKPVANQSELTAYSLRPIAEGGLQNGGRRSVAAEDGHGADGVAPSSTDVRTHHQKLKAGRLPLTDAAAARPHVFDEQFFMYGDDLDLCIRVKKAGYRIVYEGRVKITHVKGVSVAKDYDLMSQAIFDANREVYLKHFNPRRSAFTRCKYVVAFGLWKRVALVRGRLRRQRRVRPV